ncbi:hypothetical protein CVT24_001490, partial [Panaeolus cyanescens]
CRIIQLKKQLFVAEQTLIILAFEQCPPRKLKEIRPLNKLLIVGISKSNVEQLLIVLKCLVLHEISQLLNTQLDKSTLAKCIGMIENGVNPEALAAVIQELRREGAKSG